MQPGTHRALADIGLVLAQGVTSQPLRTLALIWVIAGVVALGSAIGLTSLAPVSVFFIAFFIMNGGLFYLGLIEQRRAVNPLAGTTKVTESTPMAVLHALPMKRKRQLQTILEASAAEAARVLEVAPAHVRANLFALDSDGRIRIVPEYSHNMTRPEELSIAFAPNEGVAGAALQDGKPTYAVYEPNWGRYAIPGDELAKADPRLRWIISFPIRDSGGPKWVLNIDGLDDDVSPTGLRLAVAELANWYGLAALALLGGEA
jgi:hypothetical protein